MAQIISVSARLGDARLFFHERAARRLPGAIARAQIIRLREEAAMRVDKRPMRAGIDERALIVLAMDFDEFAADGAQRLGGRRLIVDEGAGAAVSRLHAAQHEFVFARKAEFAGGEMGGMARRRIEDRRHLTLLSASPHERRVAAPA